MTFHGFKRRVHMYFNSSMRSERARIFPLCIYFSSGMDLFILISYRRNIFELRVGLEKPAHPVYLTFILKIDATLLRWILELGASISSVFHQEVYHSRPKGVDLLDRVSETEAQDNAIAWER